MSDSTFQRTNSTFSENEPESGSFVTGFTLGIFAGAVGYYLFGTRDGKSLVKDIQSEWQVAQQHFQTTAPEPSFHSPLGWWSSLKQELRQIAQAEATKPVSSKKKPAAAKSKSKAKHTFTGV